MSIRFVAPEENRSAEQRLLRQSESDIRKMMMMSRLVNSFMKKHPVEILLVDDREDNLLALEATLSSPDYRLVKALSGDQALRYLLDHEPAAILMDVQMPELDGFETAKIIKKSERSAHIPIIFITAINKEERFLHAGYQSGAVDYLSKPFDPEILRSKVSVFVDLFRKTKMLVEQERLLRQAELRETERKLAQLEVQSLRREHAEKQRYIDLVDGIEQGIVWAADAVTLNTTFVSKSAERLTGYSLRDWKDEVGFFASRVHAEDQENFTRTVKEAGSSDEGCRVEHRFLRKDGSIAWLQTWVRLCDRSDGLGQEIHGLSVDITDLKETEDELRQAIVSRDEFFSVASHELKTPVTPIKLQIQLIQRALAMGGTKAFSEDRLKRSLSTCEKQINRLAKLVDELLDVSRVSTGKLSLDITEFDLDELISDTVERFQEEAKTKNLSLIFPSAGREVLVTLDRFRVEQVLVNLIANAVKYSDKGTITVELSADQERATFSVRDEGIGINPQDKSRIFDRFERAVPSNNYAGLGLGLYIVTQILKAQNGTIEVESIPRKGSTFTVHLPLRLAPGLRIERPQHGQLSSGT